MTLEAAIEAVRLGHAQRICEPGKWIVSRDYTVVVQHLGVHDYGQTTETEAPAA